MDMLPMKIAFYDRTARGVRQCAGHLAGSCYYNI